MTAGNIFTIMINDGKQDVMLNATDRLKKRIDQIARARLQRTLAEDRARFSAPAKPGDTTWEQDRAKWGRDPGAFARSRSKAVHATLVEIAKTHNLFVGKFYKPFVAMSFSYIKVGEKEGQPKFGGDMTFVIPRIGTWVHDMVLHIRLTGLRCTDARDKAKYCSLLGHRILKKVQFTVNGVSLSEYGSEHMNRHYNFRVEPHKKTAWLRNIGHEVPNLAYVTPDPRANEYREYRWFGDGPQTLKREHTEVDMYIPLLFWFNLNAAESFPNCMVPHGNVKVCVALEELNKLVSAVDYGGGGAFTPPTISTCDMYVDHINTLEEVEEVMMRDYVYQLIRIPRSFTKTLQVNEGAIHLKDLKFPVENIAVAFRPVENTEDIDVWHRNTWLDPVDILQPMAVLDTTGDPPSPASAINWARYYTERPTVGQVGMKINDIEIHPIDTTAKYSNFHTYAAPGLMAPEDQGWMLFTHQFNQGYDPSGHIDLSKNREIYLHYKGDDISDLKKVQVIVEAQCINFLTIKSGSVNLKYYK